MRLREILYKPVGTSLGLSLPFSELDILLCHILGKSREFLYSHPEYNLTKPQLVKFKLLVKRRQQDEPIAYITGHKEFYGLDFVITPAVLIPRPDTELLVDTVLEYCGKKKYIIADIGTGSGNIAITLKHQLPSCDVIASDVSAAAVRVARANAKRLRTPITFYTSNVLKQLPKTLHGAIDILIFNAPYLTKQEAGKQNLHYEPQLALTPTDSPTSLIEQLLQQAAPFLAPQGLIVLEMGYRQADQVSKLCNKYFPKSTITVKKDLGGFDRLVVCYS